MNADYRLFLYLLNGPISKQLSYFYNQITNLVAKLDNLTGYIQEKLIENGLDKRVNVIHLSDHGMSSVSPPNFINLQNFVADDSCRMFGSSPVVQIVPNDASEFKSFNFDLRFIIHELNSI